MERERESERESSEQASPSSSLPGNLNGTQRMRTVVRFCLLSPMHIIAYKSHKSKREKWISTLSCSNLSLQWL